MNGLFYKFLFKLLLFFKKKVSSVWIIIAVFVTGYIVCGLQKCSANQPRTTYQNDTNEAHTERELLDSNRWALDESFWPDSDSEDDVLGSLEPVGVDN